MLEKAAAVRKLVFGLRGHQVHIPTGVDRRVAAALEHPADVVDVTTGLDGQVVGGFDAGGAVGVRAAGAEITVAGLRGGHAALVDHVTVDGSQGDVTARDDAAGLVDEVVAGQQIEAVARLHQAAVDQVIAGHGGQIVAGAQSAGVVQVVPGDQGHVAALDQCPVGCQAIVGVGQVQHRHQHVLAIDLHGFHPDDVVGECGDLFGGEGYAKRQIQRLLAGDGVVHQVLEHGLVRGQAVEKALTGTGDHRLLNQALFIQAIAEALGAVVRIVAEVAQQVIRAHELLEVGEDRVGFDQVFVSVARRFDIR
ncbi:hypothetical protein D3C84_691680 [compost metagenome]